MVHRIAATEIPRRKLQPKVYLILQWELTALQVRPACHMLAANLPSNSGYISKLGTQEPAGLSCVPFAKLLEDQSHSN